MPEQFPKNAGDGALPAPLGTNQKEKFLLALYKLDEFRDFLSSPEFQEEFKIAEEEIRSVLSDDLKLLRFGIHWLKETLFAEKDD